MNERSAFVAKLDPVLAFGLLVGLSLPLLDLNLSAGRSLWLPGGLTLALPWVLIVSQVASSAAILVGYGLLWSLIGRPLQQRFGVSREALAAALAVLLTVPLLFWFGADARETVLLSLDSRGVSILLGTGLAAAGITFAIVRLLSTRSHARGVVATLGLIAPLLLAIAYLLLWTKSHWHLSLDSLAFLGVTGLFLFAGLLLFRGARRLEARTLLRGVLGSVGGALLVSLLAGIPATDARAAPRDRGSSLPDPPSVVLISIDTLRRDALSCYGAENPTPAIDSLAADGVVFDRACASAPWTVPSVTSIMTGLSPWVHGVLDAGSVRFEGLHPLAERLQQVGYRTKSVGYNPFIASHYVGPPGAQEGFDESTFAPKRPRPHTAAYGAFSGWFPAQSAADLNTEEITRLACDWIEARSEESFFLWIHYFDPHGPYEPPSELLPDREPPPGLSSTFELSRFASERLTAEEREWVEDLYLAEVRHVDGGVGRVLDVLKEHGLYDDALIVLVSDHGEELGEHERLGHGHTLYGELLSVPLIFKLPGAGHVARIEPRVSLEGVLPTILDVLGLPYDGQLLSGESLATLWERDVDPRTDRPVYATGLEKGDDREAVTVGDMKYVRALNGADEQLFDLRQDPGEEVDVAAGHPDLVAACRALLDAQHEESARLREELGVVSREEVPIDPDLERLLRSLGYLY